MVDLSKLSMGALRRYQAWFKIPIPNAVREKTEVLEYVKKHFDSLQIDVDSVVNSFLQIKKDSKPEDHFLRYFYDLITRIGSL